MKHILFLLIPLLLLTACSPTEKSFLMNEQYCYLYLDGADFGIDKDEFEKTHTPQGGFEKGTNAQQEDVLVCKGRLLEEEGVLSYVFGNNMLEEEGKLIGYTFQVDGEGAYDALCQRLEALLASKNYAFRPGPARDFERPAGEVGVLVVKGYRGSFRLNTLPKDLQEKLNSSAKAIYGKLPKDNAYSVYADVELTEEMQDPVQLFAVEKLRKEDGSIAARITIHAAPVAMINRLLSSAP